MKTAITAGGWVAALATTGAAGYTWAEWLGVPGILVGGVGGYIVGRMLGAWTSERHR